MKTLNTITILPGTKQEIATFCHKAKQEILAGDYNPLEILKQLKGIETVIKNLLKDEDLKNCFQEEAMKYEGTTFEYSGAKFQLKNGRAIYNYTNCGDTEYAMLKSTFNLASENLKAREKWLQGLKKPIPNENGELCNAPTKESSTVLSVTIQ